MKRLLLGVLRSALVALTVAVAGCGGGGGSSAPTAAPALPSVLRTDLHVGYYWGCRNYIFDQADHVDTWFVTGRCASNPNAQWFERVAEELVAVRAAGIKNIVLHPDGYEPVWLRGQLKELSDLGWFTGWDSIALYPMDEPESPAGGSHSDADVTSIITKVRQVMFDTPGLLTAKVGVLYGCENGLRPGIKSYDLVGCFRYESSGCAKLESDYAGLRSKLAIDAKLWMAPGGATINNKEGHQDPACWAAYAHSHPDVWGFLSFMWDSSADQSILGIRDNGMRKPYCEMGHSMLKPKEASTC